MEKKITVPNYLIAISISVLIAIHFCLIIVFIEPFPAWGDDWVYLSTIDSFLIKGNHSIIDYVLPFHGGVHSILFGKIYTSIYFLIFDNFNYKSSVFFANLLIIPILWIYLNYAKLIKINPLHFIGIALVFFSLKGNADNYNLGGVTLHDALSVFFITYISYLIAIKKNFSLGIILANIFLLLASTEAIGILFLANLFSFLNNYKFRFLTLLTSLICILIYFWGIQISQKALHVNASELQFNLGIFLSPILFIGGLFSNFYIALILGICYSVLTFICWIKSPNSFKEKIKDENMFLPIILISIMSVGIMVQLTRGFDENGNLSYNSLTANRFSYYHLMPLVIVYISVIKLINFNWGKIEFAFIMLALLFYLFNLKSQIPILKFEKERILADAYNYKENEISVLYPSDSTFIKKIKKWTWVEWPNLEKLYRFKNEVPVKFKFEIAGELTSFTLETLGQNESGYFALRSNNKKILVYAKKIDANHFNVNLNTNQIKQLTSIKATQLY